MKINSKDDITSASLRFIREKLALSQREFWPGVGVDDSSGSAYETGRTPIPDPVRRVVFLHYIVGIPTDLPLSSLRSAGLMSEINAKVRDAQSTKRMSEHLNNILAGAAGIKKEIGRGK